MTNKCQNCGGVARLVQVSAKCSDLFHSVSGKTHKEYEGYVPDWIGSYGDYVEFTVCRHCGQMQGDWPVGRDGKDKFKWGKAS